jgi:hypothetical protein
MSSSYVDLLMDEWSVTKQSPRIQASMRRVLNELDGECQVFLRREPRLEVMFRPNGPHSVWAFFPIHKRRWIAKEYKPKSETRILLLFGTENFEQDAVRSTDDYLRHHLGHVLLYLHSPGARNDCPDAEREWKRCTSNHRALQLSKKSKNMFVGRAQESGG